MGINRLITIIPVKHNDKLLSQSKNGSVCHKISVISLKNVQNIRILCGFFFVVSFVRVSADYYIYLQLYSYNNM